MQRSSVAIQDAMLAELRGRLEKIDSDVFNTRNSYARLKDAQRELSHRYCSRRWALLYILLQLYLVQTTSGSEHADAPSQTRSSDRFERRGASVPVGNHSLSI